MEEPEMRSGLAMTQQQMRDLAERVTEVLVDRHETLGSTLAWDGEFREILEKELGGPPPEQGRAADTVIDQVVQHVLPYAARLDHPRFFGFIPSSPTWPGILADFLASGFNINSCTWLVSSGTSQLELVVTDWMRNWIGYPETAGGLLTSGASAASVEALVAAREAAKNPAQPAIYMSDQSHSSLKRAAVIIGVQRENVRLVRTDDAYRLDVNELKQLVREDRAAGLQPIAVCANAGSPSTGSIDPLKILADFCASESIWLHVDAAYGGFALVTEEGRRQLDGIDRADSVGLDAHKWFFQPYEAGALLVKDMAHLEDVFALNHDVLQDTVWGANHPNFADRGIQLSRAARALKIWMSVQTFGLAAFRAAIQNGMDLTRQAVEYIESNPMLELLTPASLSIVCFRVNPRGTISEETLDEINRKVLALLFWDEFAFISSTTLKGVFSLRMCILNHTTTWEDVRRSLDRVVQHGSESTLNDDANAT